METVLVVRKGKGAEVFQYLIQENVWTTMPSDARLYGSYIAFIDAEEFGGSVFLRFAQGREIAVELADVLYDGRHRTGYQAARARRGAK